MTEPRGCEGPGRVGIATTVAVAPEDVEDPSATAVVGDVDGSTTGLGEAAGVTEVDADAAVDGAVGICGVNEGVSTWNQRPQAVQGGPRELSFPRWSKWCEEQMRSQ